MPASLQSRLLLTYLLVIAIVLALVGVGLLVFLVRNPIAERTLYARMELAGKLIAEREARGFFSSSPDRLAAALARIDLPEGRAVVLEADASASLDTKPGQALPQKTILEALSSPRRGAFGEGASARMYVSLPIEEGRTLLLIAARPKLRALALLGDDLVRPLLQAGAVAFLLAAVLAWLMSRWVAAPLHRMAQSARAVAEGDYRAPPAPAGPAEMESLALAFQDMVAKVKSSQQSQRDFVANVSHELKTPLTSIQGFAQAILDGTAGAPERQAQAARVIYEEADRLRRLVEDLLDLARWDAGQVEMRREPVALEALARAVIERLSLRAAEKGVRVESAIEPLPNVVGDGDRLAQVVTNLLDNAIQHTPSGGSVRVTGSAGGGEVALVVQDSGPGIPAEDLSRVFERFYQVDRARPGGAGRGVGLGLAISREIVQAHGGRLTAESPPGAGSRFTLQLPEPRPSDSTAPARRSRL
ncbi:MAG TPA: HAMP domain-containing sensor histidine kinase [Anaerolineales bacterium]|nr:HAMP domain-containing sensor histidine kinase [Anaerolineales bacterium]